MPVHPRDKTPPGGIATIVAKVVPGARVSRVMGRYGDSIKLSVSAPPEDGKANRAVVELIAQTLGLKVHQVTIVKGHGQSRKIVQIDGLNQRSVDARLAQAE